MQQNATKCANSTTVATTKKLYMYTSIKMKKKKSEAIF